MSGSTLVSTGELAAKPHQVASLRLPPRPRQSQARRAAIPRRPYPGALFAHLDRDLSGRKTGANGRHPLPEPEEFEKWLEKTGLTPQDQAVCYDGGPARWRRACGGCCAGSGTTRSPSSTAASRSGRRKAGRSRSTCRCSLPSTIRSSAQAMHAVDVRAVERKLGKSVSARRPRPARYRGEQEPIDPVAGRINGAKNRFNMDNVSAHGTFKSPAELKKDFAIGPARSLTRRSHPLLRLGRGRVPQPARDGDRGPEGRQALRRLVERMERGPEAPQERLAVGA